MQTKWHLSNSTENTTRSAKRRKQNIVQSFLHFQVFDIFTYADESAVSTNEPVCHYRITLSALNADVSRVKHGFKLLKELISSFLMSLSCIQI